ncbi:Uu.00g071730.m01.CDS01 [Anthostomella pinea]|uniref:Uu.00g071730.m01.CDS01 n=1 Tax=Anthostomella pinea TaxID=933095 RepID=A0AAI8VW60_9PEZI|nr:Uu.00g071730.m01.CDS01 [Anthostomella pinea]
MALRNVLLAAATLAALAGAIPVRRQAAVLPVVVLEGSPDLAGLSLTEASEVLYRYHKVLGQEGTSAIVAPDVAAADTFWHKILSNTTGGWVGGTTRIQGLADPAVFSGKDVGTWFAGGGTGWPNDFLETSPTHYLSFSAGGTSDARAAIETIEGWGANGPITYFKGIPEAKPAFIPALAEFGSSQSALAFTLGDGTVFAHSLTAFRDLPDGSGVEVFQGIWVPDSAPAYVVRGATEHITVEFANWLRFAYNKATGA